MTDKEFTTEIIRHLRAIMIACIRKFGLDWEDFAPREENAVIRQLARNQSASQYVDVGESRPGS